VPLSLDEMEAEEKREKVDRGNDILKPINSEAIIT